jgi:hypothetical protein
MTTRDDSSGGTVDRLLRDAGHTDAPDLRAALYSLAMLAQLPAPAPGPELAAMLAGPRDELTRQRWLRRHRPAVVGLTVLAGMGLGVSGVAATSPAPGPASGRWSVQQLTTGWTPEWSIPVPSRPTGAEPPIAWASPLYLQLTQDRSGEAGSAQAPASQPAGADDPKGRAADPAPLPPEEKPASSNRGLAAGPASAKGGTGKASRARGESWKASRIRGDSWKASRGRGDSWKDKVAVRGSSKKADSDEAAAPRAGGASGVQDAATIELWKSGELRMSGELQKPGARKQPPRLTIDSTLGSGRIWLGKFPR